MTETPAPRLKWNRSTLLGGDGCYLARDDQFTYLVFRVDRHWKIQVHETREIAGLKTSVGQPVIHSGEHDTAKLCKAIAAQYSAFGPEFRQCDHGGMERMTAAVIETYDLDREGKL